MFVEKADDGKDEVLPRVYGTCFNSPITQKAEVFVFIQPSRSPSTLGFGLVDGEEEMRLPTRRRDRRFSTNQRNASELDVDRPIGFLNTSGLNGLIESILVCLDH